MVNACMWNFSKHTYIIITIHEGDPPAITSAPLCLPYLPHNHCRIVYGQSSLPRPPYCWYSIAMCERFWEKMSSGILYFFDRFCFVLLFVFFFFSWCFRRTHAFGRRSSSDCLFFFIFIRRKEKFVFEISSSFYFTQTTTTTKIEQNNISLDKYHQRER